jgi:hypothetical protein
MDKRGGFAADLQSIQADVSHDVGAILRIAKEQKTAAPVVEIPQPIAPPEPQSKTPRGEISRRVSAARSAPRPTPSGQPGPPSRGLENVTTRLSPETNSLLTEAALRQRLKNERPATRQDIIETAVREWLERQGYGSRRNPIRWRRRSAALARKATPRLHDLWSIALQFSLP